VTPELAKQFSVSEAKGALITDVLENSPAAKAGLQQGDVIVSYDGKPVENPGSLRNHVAETAIGRKVKIGIIRDKKEKELEVVIAEQPKDMAQMGGEEKSAPSDHVSTALAGLEVSELTPSLARQLGISKSEKGVVITQIDSGSTAMAAGLRVGDLIVEMNRQPITSLKEYNRVASKVRKDDSILLLINRQGRNSYFALKP